MILKAGGLPPLNLTAYWKSCIRTFTLEGLLTGRMSTTLSVRRMIMLMPWTAANTVLNKGTKDMSAPDGICLHQIVGELEKIKKSMEEDMTEMKTEEDWLILWNHVYDIRKIIENINNA